jgi:glycosyltransferase involved in cell wall biosynthesis
MRVLFVSRHFPEDLSIKVHGVFKRFQMFLDAIKDIAEIDLLYYVPHGINTSPSSVIQLEHSFSTHFKVPIRLFLCEISKHKNLVSKLISYAAGTFVFVKQPLYSGAAGFRQVKAFEACLRNNPDAVFVHRLGAMCPLLQTRRALPSVFFDLDDIEHIAFGRGLRYIRKFSTKLLNYLLLPALFRGEYKAVRLAHRTFVCSDQDREYLMNRWRLNGVVKVPNAVEMPDPQPVVSAQTLLFLGSYNYKPNIDAAEFLIRKIWPLIHRESPNATLIVAGSPPDKIPSYSSGMPGVRFTGFVEDLDDLYRQSRVVCAPILSGSGTRVKIIEAAAYGKPIVSTRIGAEGIEMNNGNEIFLRDNPKAFAKMCIRLLNDYELCEQMGTAARTTVMDKYNQVKIKKIIQEIIKESL